MTWIEITEIEAARKSYLLRSLRTMYVVHRTFLARMQNPLLVDEHFRQTCSMKELHVDNRSWQALTSTNLSKGTGGNRR